MRNPYDHELVLALVSDSEVLAARPDASGALSRFPVGPGWRFEPSGCWVARGREIAVILDRGPVVDNYVAETAMFGLFTGVRV
jgi:hypothetical protein